MKEPRFIELLNLYVDQQLNAVEATELESELQHNSSRCRTYHQYCRIQKACTELFERECLAAPSTSALSRALAKADQKIIAFPRHRHVWRQRSLFAVGLVAMAACVAVVFMRQPAGTGTVSTPLALNLASAVATVEPVATSTQSVNIPSADPHTKELRRLYYAVFPVRQFVPVQVVSANGDSVAQNQEQTDYNWMKNVELAPMRSVNVDELAMESNNPTIQQPERPYINNNRRPVQEMYEKAAFQFQK